MRRVTYAGCLPSGEPRPMLRALPVVKISAREPDMAGTASAGRGKTPSSETTRRTRASASPKAGGATKRRRTGTSSASDKAGRLPVRAGEERWTTEELAAVRSELNQENDGLLAEIAKAETQIAD